MSLSIVSSLPRIVARGSARGQPGRRARSGVDRLHAVHGIAGFSAAPSELSAITRDLLKVYGSFWSDNVGHGLKVPPVPGHRGLKSCLFSQNPPVASGRS
jgi:hypothetical protein